MYFLLMAPLYLRDHVVQRTGEQMTHWDMLNNENSNLMVLCLDWTRKVRIGCVALLKVVNPQSLQNLPHIFELESSPSVDKLW